MAGCGPTRFDRAGHTLRQFAGSLHGTIAVEFAMMAPVVLVMALGIVEIAVATSNGLAVQSAARAGTHYGLTKPPLQGDMSQIIAAVKAAMPASWTANGAADAPVITANLVCECEQTGPVACGAPCAKDEASLTYLKVDVSKTYTPIVTLRYFTPSFQFQNSSQVRLK